MQQPHKPNIQTCLIASSINSRAITVCVCCSDGDCEQWISHHTETEHLCVIWFVEIVLRCFPTFSSLGTDFSVTYVLLQCIPQVLPLQIPEERDM